MTPLGFDDELRELLLDHYRRPRHRGRLAHATHTATVHNRQCGESLTVELALEGERIAALGFSGQVCAVAQAAASLMTARLHGCTVAEARETAASFRHMMEDAEPDASLGEMATLVKVTAFPGRTDCALLCWDALDEALEASAPPSAAEPAARR